MLKILSTTLSKEGVRTALEIYLRYWYVVNVKLYSSLDTVLLLFLEETVHDFVYEL